MTSNDTGVLEHTLINLVYRHLKENGHKEAARVLRKHAPKVETKRMKVSLSDIFRQWLSEKQKKKNVEALLEKFAGKINTISSSGNSVSKSKAAKNVTAVRTKDTLKKTAAKKDQKPSISVEDQATEHASLNPTTHDDSDSDSSLDVDKWKKLALELSDADIAKMDANINLTTSVANNSTKKQNTTKKDQNQHKVQSRTKKPKDTTTTSQTKADKLEKLSKSKPKKITNSEAVNIKTQSKNIKDRIYVESATAISLLETVGIPKADVNGRLMTDNMKVDKVRRKTMDCVSETNNTETENGVFEETDNLLMFRTTDTPSRKDKTRKAFNLSESVDCGGVKKTQSALDNETVKTPAKKLKPIKGQLVHPVDINTPEEAANTPLSSDPSKIGCPANTEPAETPSKKCKFKKAPDQILDDGHIETPKKVKSKKSKAVDVSTSSVSCHSQPHQSKPQSENSTAKDANLSVALPVKALPGKVKKSSTGLNETETPKKKESHLDVFSTSNIMSDVISETPSKKSKKCKRRRSENSENMPPAPESGCDNSQLNNGLVLYDTAKQVHGVENRMGSENENGSASGGEEGSSEPKKRKKNKKDKKKKTEIEERVVEEVTARKASDQLTDSITSSQGKKKKKRKHRDENEMQTMQTMPTPTPEEQTPKKKRKSSKEKRDTSDEAELKLN